jgi:phage/plasmid-associated DNA primase
MDDTAIFEAVNNEGIAAPPEAIQKAQLIAASDVVNEIVHDAYSAKNPSYVFAGTVASGKDKGQPDGTYHIDYMKYSDMLIGIYHFRNFKKNLFIYDPVRGVYKHHNNEVETHTRDTIKTYNISDRLTIAAREILLHVKSMGCSDNYPFIGEFGTIHVRNGSLNIETGEIKKTTPEMLYDYRIETPYKKFDPDYNSLSVIGKDFDVIKTPEATTDLDTFLKQYGTDEPIQILAKAIWQRAYHDTLKELTVLYGPRDVGKTTLAEFVQATVDGNLTSKNNVGRALLHELLIRFGMSDLEGKLINYGDDLPDMFVKNSGRINTLVGSVNLHIEKKGVDGYDGVVTAYHVFSANNLPVLDDDDDAIWSKIRLVHLDKEIVGDKIVREKLFTPTLKEQLLYRAVQLVLSWRTTPYVKNLDTEGIRTEWHAATTDVDLFMLECTMQNYDRESKIPYVSLDQIKRCYEKWCTINKKHRHMKYLNKKVQPYLHRSADGNAYALVLKDLKDLKVPEPKTKQAEWN